MACRARARGSRPDAGWSTRWPRALFRRAGSGRIERDQRAGLAGAREHFGGLDHVVAPEALGFLGEALLDELGQTLVCLERLANELALFGIGRPQFVDERVVLFRDVVQ